MPGVFSRPEFDERLQRAQKQNPGMQNTLMGMYGAAYYPEMRGPATPQTQSNPVQPAPGPVPAMPSSVPAAPGVGAVQNAAMPGAGASINMNPTGRSPGLMITSAFGGNGFTKSGAR